MNYCGIDVSQATLDCCYLVDENPYYRVFSNDIDGFEELLSFAHTLDMEKIGFEATGSYGKKLEKYLLDNGVAPFTIKPLAISHYAKTLKIQGKTDKTDAFIIAKFLVHNSDLLALSYPTRDLMKPYHASMNMMEKQKRQLKNLIHSIELYPEVSPVLKNLDSILKDTIKTQSTIEKKAYKVLIEACPEAERIRDDIKGVGKGVLIHVLPLIYDHFDKFTLKQMNSFVGLNPVKFQSGTSIKKREYVSKRGDKRTLNMLYMSAVSAIRHNDILKEKYLRLKEMGKPSKVALVAIMSHIFRAIIYRLAFYTKRQIKK